MEPQASFQPRTEWERRAAIEIATHDCAVPGCSSRAAGWSFKQDIIYPKNLTEILEEPWITSREAFVLLCREHLQDALNGRLDPRVVIFEQEVAAARRAKAQAPVEREGGN